MGNRRRFDMEHIITHVPATDASLVGWIRLVRYACRPVVIIAVTTLQPKLHKVSGRMAAGDRKTSPCSSDFVDFSWRHTFEMVVHAVHMIDNRERDETHTTVELENLRLIRSIAEDTRVALVVGCANPNWRRVVALSRGERVVAYILACVTFLFAVMVRR